LLATAGTDVGVVTTVFVTITPLSVHITMLVNGVVSVDTSVGASVGARLLLGAAVVVLSVVDAGVDLL
jgi:hypothetical protein